MIFRGDRGRCWEAGVSAFEHEGAVVEAQCRFLFFRSVAFDAVVGEDGVDVFLVGELGLGVESRE